MYFDTRRGLKSGCHQAVLISDVSRMEPRCSHMPLKRIIEIIGSKVVMREKKAPSWNCLVQDIMVGIQNSIQR